jgi:hypothetical protein
MLTSAFLLALTTSGLVVSAAPSPAPAPEGIAIPIGKSAEYLAKRKTDVVDLSWLKSNKPAVVQ